MERMTIAVKDDRDNWSETYATIVRVPRVHKGWQSVTYKGKRFQLFGGIRNAPFINRNHPIPGKKYFQARSPEQNAPRGKHEQRN